MSTGCGGTCTWTYDGNYWTCADSCAPGCNCTDIVPVPPGSPAGTSVTVSKPLSATDPTVKSLLHKVVDGGTDSKGKKIWKVPDALLRRVIHLHKLTTTPDLNNSTFKTQFSAASTTSPVSIDVDCV